MRKLKNLGLIAILAMVFVGCSQDVVTSGVEATATTASRATYSGSDLVGTTISLKASNGLYVCSEIRTDNAPLEADRSKAVTWETFEVVDAGDGYIAFVAYNGNYVCADKNYSGTPLLANRTAIGSWEKFTWIDHGDGTASIQANVNSKYWKHSNDSTDDYTVTAGAYTMHSATIFEYDIVAGTPGNGGDVDEPADIIDLADWKLTIPFKDGEDNRNISDYDDRLMPADEYAGTSGLSNYILSGYFDIVDDGIRFRAHCAGATTSGSSYPRSELRQQVGGGDNYWSASDYQKMVTVSAITEVPEVKPEVCIAQIHGGEDEPLRVQYTKAHSRGGSSDVTTDGVYILQNPDADSFDDINSDNKKNALSYELGEKIETTIIVDDGKIYCKIENLSTGEYQEAEWTPLDSNEDYDGTGYFKAGMYTQSSIYVSDFKSQYTENEDPDAAGEMILYSMSLTETY